MFTHSDEFNAVQTDKALARLLSNPEEWTEYSRLWNEQRGHSIWENEDVSKRQSAAKASSSNRKDDAAKVSESAGTAFAAQSSIQMQCSPDQGICLEKCTLPHSLQLPSQHCHDR